MRAALSDVSENIFASEHIPITVVTSRRHDALRRMHWIIS